MPLWFVLPSRCRTLYVAGCIAAAALAWPSARAEPVEPKEFLNAEQRAADFAVFCDFVGQSYAYLEAKSIDWRRACAFYAAQTGAPAPREAYVNLLERALGELFDAHAHLGTHTASSYRLVPSQTDVLARWEGDRALIEAVRAGSAAARVGLRPGQEVLAIQGTATLVAVRAVQPRFTSDTNSAARHWALQAALAGRHQDDRLRLTIRQTNGAAHDLDFEPHHAEAKRPLSARVLGTLGYIRLHNSLGQQDLVAAFDEALASLQDQEALVIDLRDTPSGGNSSVARGLLGRLVDRLSPYQRHELASEFMTTGVRRIWDEYVAPRGHPYMKPIVALVGPWTGSMGEGLAIGLNATRGATVLGQPMAKLLGALGERLLPHSKITVRVPVERLFHVNGMPREAVVPCAIRLKADDAGDEDVELKAALTLAAQLAGQMGSRPGAAASHSGSATAPLACLGPNSAHWHGAGPQ